MIDALICLNSFKGVMNSTEVNGIVERGIRSAAPGGVRLHTLPVADGGDGSLDAIAARHPQMEMVEAFCENPLGTTIPVPIGRLRTASGITAYIETGDIIGAKLFDKLDFDTRLGSSYGVGQAIIHCVEGLGADHIVLFLGGSMISDCGLGLAQAMGAEISVASADERLNATHLKLVTAIDGRGILARLRGVRITCCSDVNMPLLGAKGQAKTFGPQKGLSAESIAELERGYQHLSVLLNGVHPINASAARLAGAAGGLATGLASLTHANLVLGAQYFYEELRIEPQLEQVSALVTGEGRADATTRLGKLPHYLCARGRSLGKTVLFVGGTARSDFFDGKRFYDYFIYGPDRGPTPDKQQIVDDLFKSGERAAALLDVRPSTKLRMQSRTRDSQL